MLTNILVSRYPGDFPWKSTNRRCELKKTAFIFFNSWGGGPNLGRWAERTSPAHVNKKNGTCGAGAGSSATIGSFSFFNSPWGCTFYFLIRILLGKWRWSWVQRQMLHLLFFNSRGNQKVHEKGRRESCGALDRCILHRISVRTTL